MFRKFTFIIYALFLVAVFFFDIPAAAIHPGGNLFIEDVFAEEKNTALQSYIKQGDIYMERGDRLSACLLYKEAEKIYPDSVYLHEKYNTAALLMANFELAKEELKKVIRLKKQKEHPRREYFYFFSLISVLFLLLIARLLSKHMSLGNLLRGLSSFSVSDIMIMALLALLLLTSRIPLLPPAMNLGYGETMYRASIAKDLIEGLKTSSFDYQYAGYNGGMLLMGFLAVPFLLLFGDTFFSFALLPLLFSVGTLILMYQLLLKFFSRDAAIIASFLFVALAPLSFAQRSMMASGDHVESVFFILALLSMFYEIFFNRELNPVYYGIREDHYLKRKIYLLFALSGIISGIALYACYSFIVFVFTFFIFWFVFDKRFILKRYFLVFLFTFFLGFSPWFLYNIPRHWQGLNLPPPPKLFTQPRAPLPTNGVDSFSSMPSGLEVPTNFSGQNTFTVLDALPKRINIRKLINSLDIFSLEIQRLLFYPKNNFIPVDLVYNIMLFVFFVTLALNLKLVGKLALSLFSFRKVKEDNPEIYRETIIFLLLVFYVLAYIFYPMEWPKIQYLFPVLPFLFILTGIFVDKIYKHRVFFPLGPILGIFITAGLIFVGLFNCRDMVNYRQGKISISDMFKLKAYSLIGLDEFLPCPNSIYMLDFYHSGSLYKLDRIFTNPVLRRKFSSCKYDIDKRYSYIEHEKPEVRYPIYLLSGINIGDGICSISNKDYNALILLNVSPQYRHCIYEGIALSFTNRFFKELLEAFKSGLVAKNIPKEYRHYFYTEFGRRIGEKYKGDLRQGSRLIEGFEDEYRAYLYRGFSSFLRGKSIREACNSQISLVEKRYGGDFYSQWGAVASRDYYKGMLDNKGLSDLTEQLPDAYKPFFIMGLARECYNFSKNNFQKDFMVELKEGVELFYDFASDKRYARFIYKGLGCGLSLKTYGQLKGYSVSINELVPLEYLDSFYRGCGAGLSLRYGQDKEEINRIIREEIPSKYQASSYEGAREY